MPSTVTVGSMEFKVDLQEFSAAITRVTGDRSQIETDFGTIKVLLEEVSATWASPAGATFPPLQEEMATAMQNLLDALEDMIGRMHTTYANYEEAENTNVANLRTSGPRGGASHAATGGTHGATGTADLRSAAERTAATATTPVSKDATVVAGMRSGSTPGEP